MGTHQTNISAWIRGRIPALGFALTIERLTGIPAKEWTEDAEAPRPSRPPRGSSARRDIPPSLSGIAARAMAERVDFPVRSLRT